MNRTCDQCGIIGNDDRDGPRYVGRYVVQEDTVPRRPALSAISLCPSCLDKLRISLYTHTVQQQRSRSPEW